MPRRKKTPFSNNNPVVFVASEGVPYVKTGGLADVVGALPKALAKKSIPVWVFLPLYRSIRNKFHPEKTEHTFELPVDGRSESIVIYKSEPTPGVTVFFVEAESFFDRDGIYGPTPGTDFPDNDIRFSIFCRAVIGALKSLGRSPSIVHTHDWQTGLLPALLRTVYRNDPFFAKTRSVFTIHNMAYQGIFRAASLRHTGLPTSAFHMNGIEFYGHLNFLKAGIVYGDAISTVSPTYAKEILTPEFGYGLDGVLRSRENDLLGITNGIDVEAWNPETDSHLSRKFSFRNVAGRKDCKADLQKTVGFEVNSRTPLLGFVGRLDRQKGIDVLIDIAPTLVAQGNQMVFLGVGDRSLQAALMGLARQHPTRIHVENGFAESLAHKIYAGSDFFLMPSKYEPCGLGQLIAMRFGAIPVVTPTGGLIDTVLNESVAIAGTGFVARDMSTPSFLAAIKNGLKVFGRRADWNRLQRRAMRKDFSWKASVPRYIELYRWLGAKPR